MDSPNQVFNEIKSFSTSCVHKKQIYSLFDLPKKDEAYKKMITHIESCEICNNEFELFKLKTSAALVFIPKVMMDRDLRQTYEREVAIIFKIMNLNNHEILKKKVKKGFVFIDHLGIDLLKNLKSKAMIKAYLIALIAFVLLKLVLS